VDALPTQTLDALTEPAGADRDDPKAHAATHGPGLTTEGDS
jgi:hypothetical protein